MHRARGLPLEGRCPECGQPIGYSLQPDLLQYSDPDWLNSLASGIQCAVAAVLFSLFGAAFAIAGPKIFASQSVLLLASFSAAALLCWGGWLLTEPDPSGLGEDQYGKSRRIIRIALLIATGSTFIQLSLGFVAVPRAVAQILQLLAALVGISGVVGQFASLNYLRKIAARIPDDLIVARAQFLMFAIGALYGLILLSSLAGAVMSITNGLKAMAIGTGCIVGVTVLPLMFSTSFICSCS